MVYLILTIVITIVSIILILATLFQQSKSYGLSASIGGGSANETYWSKNKGKSKEGKLVRVTTIAGIVFFVAAIALNVGLFVS